MFDIGIGFSEIMLLAVIVILVVGPEELPSLLRTIGRYVGQVKRVADDFRAQVDDAIKEPVGEIQEGLEGITGDLDDDPFGEEDLIDFDEHNKNVLDKEKEHENETATQRALREGGVEGLKAPATKKKKSTAKVKSGAKAKTKSKSKSKTTKNQGKSTPLPADDSLLAEKSGT